LPDVQAEDHLGRLPPGQLTAGGYVPGCLSGSLAAGQLRLAGQAGRHMAGALWTERDGW